MKQIHSVYCYDIFFLARGVGGGEWATVPWTECFEKKKKKKKKTKREKKKIMQLLNLCANNKCQIRIYKKYENKSPKQLYIMLKKFYLSIILE